MADKLKLNKNSLREQKQMLEVYQEFLPTLELRKQQLQASQLAVQREVEAKRAELQELFAGAEPWRPMLARLMPWLRKAVTVHAVATKSGNIAGVRVPVLEQVEFEPVFYALLGSEPIHDTAVELIEAVTALREQLKVLDQQLALLERELVKTSQRINLYEKVLIPDTKENINRIKVYLGDQQTAAVCRAKIAKGKIIAKAAAAEARQGGDARGRP